MIQVCKYTGYLGIFGSYRICHIKQANLGEEGLLNHLVHLLKTCLFTYGSFFAHDLRGFFKYILGLAGFQPSTLGPIPMKSSQFTDTKQGTSDLWIWIRGVCMAERKPQKNDETSATQTERVDSLQPGLFLQRFGKELTTPHRTKLQSQSFYLRVQTWKVGKVTT